MGKRKSSKATWMLGDIDPNLERQALTFEEEIMSPGGRFYEDVAETCITFDDSDAVNSIADLRTSPFRKALPGLNGNDGMSSNNNVHDLLECPVFMNLMCPPIHQVIRLSAATQECP